MGAALSYCTPGISRAILDAPLSTAAVGDDTLVIHVEEASVEASLGAAVFDFKAQTELTLRRIRAEPGLEPLSARFRDGARQHVGDGGARSRSGARSWCVEVTGGSASTRRPVPCVLQVPILLEDRTAKRVRMDVADASDAAAYATRFNLHHQQHADGEEVPLVKVVARNDLGVRSIGHPEEAHRGGARERREARSEDPPEVGSEMGALGPGLHGSWHRAGTALELLWYCASTT